MRVFVPPTIAAFLVVSCLPGASHPTSRPVHDAIAASVEIAAAACQADPQAKSVQKSPENRELSSRRAPQSLALAVRLEIDGLAALDRGDLAGAARDHREAVNIRKKLAPASLDLAESLNNLGDVEEKLGKLAEAETDERKALGIRQKLVPESLPVAETLHCLAKVELDRGDLVDAERNLQQALSIQQKLAPGGHDIGLSLIGLANLYGRRGDVQRQEEYFHEALSLEQNLTPLNRASISEGLGDVCLQRGQFDKADEYFRNALAIRQEVLPDSLPVANSLSARGNLASNRGDLDQAEQYSEQALEIRLRIAPGSLPVATSFGELGSIAQVRGNLAQAEKYYRDALQIEQQIAPGGLPVAGSLQQLGVLAWLREDLAKSESYIEQATKIRRRIAPGSPGMGQSLNWLGILSARRGSLEQAEAYFQQAFEISEKLSPESLMTSQMLGNLGDIAQKRGRLTEAKEYFLRALAIQEKIVPDSPSEAFILQKLGDLARKRHDFSESENYLRRTLAIREKKVPGSLAHANLLLDLASLMRLEHETDASGQLFERAFDILDHQMTSLGGDETVRSVFRAKYETNYKDYIELLVSDEKNPELAFSVFERSRARTLLELLESARVDVHHGIDPELSRRQRFLRESIAAKSSYRLEMLNGPHSEAGLGALEKQINELTEQYDEVRQQIQAKSPIYAALEQPQPLSAREVQQQLLDQDTVLLEYSLAERHSYLFALTTGSLAVYPLPAQKVVESAARNVYESVTARSRRVAGETIPQRRMRVAQADLDYAKAAVELSRMILAPAAGLLNKRRLLVVSDGALQYIPFAALPVPTLPEIKPLPNGSASSAIKDESNGALMLKHEVVSLPSASALAELRRERINRREPPKAVAVFADPVFDRRDERVAQLQLRTAGTLRPSASDRSPPPRVFPLPEERWTRSATDVGLIKSRGEYLGRLLWTEREAAAILKVIPSGQAMEALGFEADRAKAVNPGLSQYRVVHFATHALLDSKNPELSGLVFSLVDKRGQPQNGFLDLQQIYNMSLPVDLVVLSACDTALGQEVRGEGLIGLARGFMYAGASRVVASLWSVDDEVTSELMARFYQSMEQDKMSPAAALRAAQIAIAKDKRWSAPYYWAGFQIQGEWK